MGETISLAQAAILLREKERILILTHERPDGDAFGSAFGMQEFLRNCCGKQADAYFPSPPSSRYAGAAVSCKQTLRKEELGSYDLILLLDCANRERIGCAPEIEGAALLEPENPPMLNIDHHVGNSVDARWNLVIPEAAATCQIMVEIALTFPCGIPSRPATFWLLGILTDTGGFRFSNTTGHTLRLAAELLDRGANLEKIVTSICYSKPLRQQRFEVELLKTRERVALGGRFLYAYIPDKLFRKYDFDMRDGEGLIDLLREVAGAKIVAIFYRRGDSFKISLRSKDRRYPVGPLARALGGGGHDMASGITLTGKKNHKEVESLLLEKVADLLNREPEQS